MIFYQCLLFGATLFTFILQAIVLFTSLYNLNLFLCAVLTIFKLNDDNKIMFLLVFVLVLLYNVALCIIFLQEQI